MLAAALRDVGLPDVEVHDRPQTLYGYEGDARAEKAEVIVRRAHIGPASNDIGFARGAGDAFEAIISEHDRRRYDGTWLTKLTRSYGYAATMKYARTNGYEVETDEVQRGRRARAMTHLTNRAQALMT